MDLIKRNKAGKVIWGILLTIITTIFVAPSIHGQEAFYQLEKKKTPNFNEIQEAFEKNWEGLPIEERKGWKQYKRWEWFWGSRVDSNGNFPDIFNTFNEVQAFREKQPESQLQADYEWSLLGPVGIPTHPSRQHGIGRINIIRFDPDDPDVYWAGSAGGGVWKSENAGASWVTFPYTQFLSLGVSDIGIAPSNPDIVYVATGDADGSSATRSPGSVGMIKTTNGGATWTMTNLAFYLSDNRILGKMLVHPDDPDNVIASAFDGIYKTTDGGATWAKKQDGRFIDMEYMPENPDVVYASTQSWGRTNWIYKSSDQGETWREVLSIASTIRIAIAVSESQPDNVYALAASSSNYGFHSVVVSEDQGEEWEVRANRSNTVDLLSRGDGTDGGVFQGHYDLAIAVAPYDEDQIVIGGINIWKSNDGGYNWNLAAHWFGGFGADYVHADIHDLVYHPGTGELFTTHDGGIDQSLNQVSWESTSNNLSVMQFYRLGLSQSNPQLFMGGSQDCGTNTHNNGSWRYEYGGDGMECAIDPTNPNKRYISLPNGNIRKSSNGGQSYSTMINSNRTGESGDWVTPYVIDPVDPTILYAGYLNVFKITKSGLEYQKISDLGNSRTMKAIAVAPSNNGTVYAATDRNIWVTKNAGATWQDITNGVRNISYIAVDPQNSNRIWVTSSGFSSNSKIYEYDGFEWTNLSGNLPNIPVNTVVYQKDSPDRLYIGTDIGVFYSDYGSAYWEEFGAGIPNVIIMELEIQQSTKKLRAATYGRGIWEIDLLDCDLPEPQVNVIGDTEFCYGESVTLEAAENYDSYLWSNGKTTKTIIVTEPGSYSLIVSDPSGCKSRSRAITVETFQVPEIFIKTSGYPVCEGDEIDVNLSAPLGFTEYLWSNGETGRKITVTELGTYSVTGTTSEGCLNTSEEFEIKYEPIPEKPTITRLSGTRLKSSEAFAYQWYKGDEEINGETSQLLDIDEIGIYSVEVFNEPGCSNTSDPIDIISGAEDENSLNASYSISPNPGNGIYNLILSNISSGSVSIRITDIQGSVVFSTEEDNFGKEFNKKIDISAQSDGVYFISINSGTSNWNTKLIKN